MKFSVKWGIAIVLFILFLLVYLIWNRPARDIEQETPAVKIEADSLYKVYSSNEKYANKIYLDKALLVSGIVGAISKNADGKTVFFLQTSDPMFGVNCTMEESVKINQGDSVQVKGICTGFTTDVILIRCYLNK